MFYLPSSNGWDSKSFYLFLKHKEKWLWVWDCKSEHLRDQDLLHYLCSVLPAGRTQQLCFQRLGSLIKERMSVVGLKMCRREQTAQASPYLQLLCLTSRRHENNPNTVSQEETNFFRSTHPSLPLRKKWMNVCFKPKQKHCVAIYLIKVVQIMSVLAGWTNRQWDFNLALPSSRLKQTLSLFFGIRSCFHWTKPWFSGETR